MDPPTQFLAQRAPETIVAKSRIGHDQDIRLRKLGGNIAEHVDSLGMFALKDDLPAVVFRLVLGDLLFEKVVTMREGQAGPAPFDHLEQTDNDNILRPGISRVILFGRMVEHLGASKDLLPRLGVD